MTTLQEVKDCIDRYFGDTTRPKEDTRDGLYELAEHCEMLGSTITVNSSDDEEDEDEVDDEGEDDDQEASF